MSDTTGARSDFIVMDKHPAHRLSDSSEPEPGLRAPKYHDLSRGFWRYPCVFIDWKVNQGVGGQSTMIAEIGTVHINALASATHTHTQRWTLFPL